MSDVYDNVGIRGGGRPARAEDGASDATAVSISTIGEGGDGEGGGGACSPVLSGDEVRREGGGCGRDEEEDFFFPVTPEQLVVLNLAEVAAGEWREGTFFVCMYYVFVMWRLTARRLDPKARQGAGDSTLTSFAGRIAIRAHIFLVFFVAPEVAVGSAMRSILARVLLHGPCGPLTC